MTSNIPIFLNFARNILVLSLFKMSQKKERSEGDEKTPVVRGSSFIGKSLFGLSPEEGHFIADLAFTLSQSSITDQELDNLLPILHKLTAHKTIESSILWRILMARVIARSSSVIKTVKRLFGGGKDQVSFVEMMRFEITGNRDQDGVFTMIGGDYLEEWMLAEFERLVPSSTPEDVAVMIDGLTRGCTMEGTRLHCLQDRQVCAQKSDRGARGLCSKSDGIAGQ